LKPCCVRLLNSSSVITIGCSVQVGWAEVRSAASKKGQPVHSFVQEK
jgi:hypothetical protein